MSLGIVSELFKHVPAHLKRLRKTRLRWEKLCPSGENFTTIISFQLHLGRARKAETSTGNLKYCFAHG